MASWLPGFSSATRNLEFGASSMRICLLLALFCFCSPISGKESTCFGTTDKGRVEDAVKLPDSGPNFVSYGNVPELVGRTYVHSKVRDVLVSAYEALEKEQAGKVFKYAESGSMQGGEFWPHKTHQNGLSVDLMVPVLDERGRSVHLPTNPLNEYGYGIEFDEHGRYNGYRIDYEALGALIVALHKSALSHGIAVRRVLFVPTLQPDLYNSSYGDYIRRHVTIPTKRSWRPHDEHIHVDFFVECRPLQ